MKWLDLGQALLAAAAAGAAVWWASASLSRSGGHLSMDSHRLPSALEAALPPHHRSTGKEKIGKGSCVCMISEQEGRIACHMLLAPFHTAPPET